MKTRTVAGSFILICLICVSSGWADEIHDAAASGDLEQVKILLQNNIDLLNQRDVKTRTPLQYAILNHHTDVARYLIEQNADINLKDKDNDSPLHYTGIFGNLEIAELLLAKGAASLNEGNSRQMTPLHFACERGHAEVVEFLLDSGADMEARDGMGRNALLCACAGRNMVTIETLLNKGADINERVVQGDNEYTTLAVAAMYGFRDLVNYLIDAGAELPESILNTTLTTAVQRDFFRLFEYVQEQGLDLANNRDKYPDLVHAASAAGSIRIVEALTALGYSLNRADRSGWTPLHSAASAGRNIMIEYLIDQGLDLNARSASGETAYHVAKFLGQKEAVAFLKGLDADTSAAKFPILKGPYMGQKAPEKIPEMFLPGIVSGPHRAHGTVTFTPDGKEAYWSDMVPGNQTVSGLKLVDGQWTPVASIMWKDPIFTPDGNRLIYISREPLREGEPGGKENYWTMVRTTAGWSEPEPMSDAINSIEIHWQCSADNQGNLYFSEFDNNMYCSHYKDGEYQPAVNLAELFGNETLTGHAPFISPKGDYLLFVHQDRLHVSFKRKDGTWTDRIDLGDHINGSTPCGSPRVSGNGKYLFFQSTQGDDRPWGIYWVSAKVLNKLRKKHAK
ncbi:ankyrin repeat domain-containing protein [Candidatus Neomarinimicrobiota bacterium]